MEAMDAIDKMIAELDREAKEKRQVIETDTKTRIDADFAAAWSQKELEIKRHSVEAKKTNRKKTISKTESANKSSQTRRD